MQAPHPRVSYADLERWPEDGRRYELYGGEVCVVPSPLPRHQIISARLYAALLDYQREHGGIVLYAPLDIVFTEYDVVQPDLLYFTATRQHLIDPNRVTRHPPDLAIEILSPGTAGNDRGRKMQLLARHGVREYWLVDSEASRVEIYSLDDATYVLAATASAGQSTNSPLLPQLRLTPHALFEMLG